MIPFRLAFPWCWLPEKGTLAADTNYYPFGTKIYVPGYGWGVVEDRGSAIKGPDRLDLYFRSHRAALEWGNRQAEATIRASD
jgi:3D (Asp-Asp-Asp) domain-containing protein